MLASRSILASALGPGACFTGSAARANLLVNGSFELPVLRSGTFMNYLAGSTDITGWADPEETAQIIRDAIARYKRQGAPRLKAAE